jgi:predicted AAA+ superfamily ATPase
MEKGGMPEYLRYGDKEALKKVYNDVLYRDVAAKYSIEDVKSLRELSFYLISNLASPYTFNSLKKFLKLGSFNTVKNYINHLEDSFLFYSVELYSPSLKKQMVSPRKIYCADNGLADSVAFKFSADKGKYLENLVFLELKRREKEVYYYKTENNLEVDFFLRGKKLELVQVSWNLTDKKTRERELKALFEAMDELKITNGLVLTDDDEETVKQGEKIVEVKPVYKWLL